MRKLTFCGFTKQYVVQLSLTGTDAIYPLAREVVADNPRLRAPLFLYAATSDRIQTIMMATKDLPVREEYSEILDRFSKDDLLKALEENSPDLPDEYHKVWRSYLSVARRPEREARVKSLMRAKIIVMQEEVGVTTYRICKDLQLNLANVNTWLKHDLPQKVSLQSARRILNYLEACVV